MRGLDYFRNPEKKRREIEKEKEAIQKDVESLAVLAGKCLADTNFQRYVDGVKLLRERIIETLMTHADPDPIKDAFFVRCCLNKLIPLQDIIKNIEREKGKGGEDAKRSA